LFQVIFQDAEDPDKPTSDAADDDLKDRNDLYVLHRVSAKTLATSYTATTQQETSEYKTTISSEA
jgi:hypothetical protein